jgi:hypothetical protein
VADRDPPRGDCADHGPHEERREAEQALRDAPASSVRAVLWNANPEPRSTIPSAARLSGMNKVEKMDPKASGNPVQSTTRTKISQT